MNNTPKWYRIGELERLSGVSRRTIHFYLAEGLLHPPVKTGKTMAYYDDRHLSKLGAIVEAKKEGLPLFAIRERLSAEDGKATAPGADQTLDKKRQPRSVQGNRTREAVLNLGCRLFRTEGYRSTRISDITKKLDIGKGTFYFYFSDKKELFLECVPRIFAELFSKGWEEISRTKDPMERLKIRGRIVMPVLKEFCQILSLCQEAIEDPDPKLQKMGRDIILSIRAPLESDLTRAMEKGLIRPVDSVIHATMIIGSMQSLYFLMEHEGAGPEDLRDKVYEMFARGLMES